MKKVATYAAAAAMTIGAASADPVESTRELYRLLDSDAPMEEVLEFFAPTYKDHNRMPQLPESMSDLEGVAGLFSQLREGFPDYKHDINLLSAAGDDTAIIHWTFTGTHSGVFFDIPASGAAVQLDGIDIFRFENNQIIEHWHVEQLMNLFAQITG